MITQPKPKRGVTSFIVKATGATVWFWIARGDGKIVCSLTKEKIIDQELEVFNATDLKVTTKKRPKINNISKNLKSELRIYNANRLIFLDNHKFCLAQVPEADCLIRSSQIHHKEGRGKLLNVISKWLPVCQNCHEWIGAHGKEAIKRGLSLQRT